MSVHPPHATIVNYATRSDYITRFTPLPSPTAASVASALVERMAARIAYFFVRHAALKRPLTPEGVAQLGRVRLGLACLIFRL